MSQPPIEKLRIFGHEAPATRRIADDDAPAADVGDNPYWAAEEDPPHPNPELGCIRRGICCRSSPGWFAPGEVEKAAELLQMPPDAFVKKFLVVDAIAVDGAPVHVFAPVKLDRFGKPALPTGRPVDALYRVLRGVCVFFKNEGCSIYAARPLECAKYVCTNAPADNASHEDIARMWRDGAAVAAE